ncbi:hypothetical protein BC342_04725 [Streptomyces olivaceus]|nr:hypothetical protein BC342_04725 [Streptomyces olivaceus]
MDGVSTYLALTFGTLLSSQGTDASFVLTLSGFPPGASLRCFQLYQAFPVLLTTLPQACGRRSSNGIRRVGYCRGKDALLRVAHPQAGVETVHGAVE